MVWWRRCVPGGVPRPPRRQPAAAAPTPLTHVLRRRHRRRIVQNLDAIKAADVIICITGMDGGLASVVAGMVEVPVIALPTSTGGWGVVSGGMAWCFGWWVVW